MDRSVWTDERLNDLASSLDRNVTLLHEEIQGLRTETREGFRELRAELGAWQRQIMQIGWALAGGLLAAIIGLILAIVS